MSVGHLTGVIAFLLVAIAAATVAYLKGRPALAAAGLASIGLPIVLLVIGRWQVSREDDGLAALGMAMGYGTLMLIMAGALLGVAILGAVLRPRPESKWARQRPPEGQPQ